MLGREVPEEPLRQGLGRVLLRRGAREDLGPVAGAHDRDLLHAREVAQLGEDPLEVLRLHGVPLAHLDRCAAVVQAQQDQVVDGLHQNAWNESAGKAITPMATRRVSRPPSAAYEARRALSPGMRPEKAITPKWIHSAMTRITSGSP